MAHSRQDDQLVLGASDRIELIATIVMALAAIATAWCAFQATKWGGIQSIEFSASNADRIESTRASNEAGQLVAIDLTVFTSWLEAIRAEVDSGAITLDAEIGYSPTAGTLSGFYFERMRPEFKVALDAWLDTGPLTSDDGPPTPFSMDEYRLEASARADELLEDSAVHRQAALDSNQNGDNYVLTTVGFALVIFFAGVSSKLDAMRNRRIAIVMAVVLFAGGVVAALSLPIVSPF